jgi:Calcineurin-like phosphoesterase
MSHTNSELFDICARNWFHSVVVFLTHSIAMQVKVNSEMATQKKEDGQANHKFDPVKEFKQHRKRLRSVEDPFLSDPGNFQSNQDSESRIREEEPHHVQIPKPHRDPPVMSLEEVIGSEAADHVTSHGQFVFHAVGDTGNPKHSALGDVVPAMARDYHRPNPADHPSLFLHLGDVCYNEYVNKNVVPASKAAMYPVQFYTPYQDYPGKIIAIPGNHDSDPEEDAHSIDAFQENFCAPLPASAKEMAEFLHAEETQRQPAHQPGVYYRFDALPFAQVIALFSNGGETQGIIRGGKAGNSQYDFLVSQLKEISAARNGGSPRSALIIAIHHPPFSGGGGHVGSATMLKDLDSAFAKAKIVPDLVLSGHAHNYQRFTRIHDGEIEVPYIVAGNGGHHITPMKPNKDGSFVQPPRKGDHKNGGDHSLRQYFNGYGHLFITVTKRIITVDLIGTYTGTSTPVDSVTVDLNSRKITNEKPQFSHPTNGEHEAHRTH